MVGIDLGEPPRRSARYVFSAGRRITFGLPSNDARDPIAFRSRLRRGGFQTDKKVLTMSVTAVIHFPVSDVTKAVEGLRGQAALLEEITENTKGAGIRHHRFVAGEGELVVIDQWESAEQFHQFFQDNVKVGQVTDAIGLAGPPVVSVFSTFDAPGTL
jgi:hypothetical protein